MKRPTFKTIDQFAELISTTPGNLHVLLSKGKINIPVYKFSRRLMFLESDIEQFIQSRRRPPHAELTIKDV